MSATRILLVEDDPVLREVLKTILLGRAYDVFTAAEGETAEALYRDHRPELAVVEMLLPGPSGFRVIERLRMLAEGQLRVLMMSGNPSAAHRDYAYALGVDRFLAKPFSSAQFLNAVDLLHHRRTTPTLPAGHCA
jgi:DNA-binding response OmpR family regulator